MIATTNPATLSAKPVIDSKEKISSIICSTRHVIAQAKAELKLRESEEHYRLISENSNDLISLHNIENEFLYVSPSCRQILGYEPEELLGRRPQDVFTKKSVENEKAIAGASQVITTKKEQRCLITIITKSGEEKLIEVWLKPVFKADRLIGLQSSGRDVTEREKLLLELKTSLAKERELNDLREKFVSTASHQFRTPLTVIQSGVEIMDLYLHDLPEEKQAKFQGQFKKIQEEVSRLEHLMNDVLLLGRANAASIPFNPTINCLTTFCKNIIANKYNHRYSAERQVIFIVEGIEKPVSFDEKLIAHSIENILNNAYKYSFQKPIFFTVIYHLSQVMLNISDEGFGIPASDIKNLFQPFYRATNASEIDGTGLGLSIVKEFIEKHNGQILITSELNKGTTVSVILPIE